MADVLTKEARSRLMSRIKGKGNRGTELRLMELMRARRIAGWRRGSKLPGKPDFVFAKAKLAVFVDGCFWHACPRHGRIPKSRVEYWEKKIARNKKRDREVTRQLRALGWSVLRIWEHALRKKMENRAISRLARALEAGLAAAEIAAAATTMATTTMEYAAEDESAASAPAHLAAEGAPTEYGATPRDAPQQQKPVPKRDH
jgi:DNA mismatch endonuclease Vsr